MAKGSAMGLWRGKKGSNVFYRIANSSNGQQQGIRQRVFDIANPKTAAQAQQRIKMRAAQNFYNALAPILDRARQGVKYGGMTRQDFMSTALKMVDGFPYIEKGDPTAVPGEYLIAKGSLNGFSLLSYNVANHSISFNSPVTLSQRIQGDNELTAEDITALTASGTIHEGDQITFVRVQKIGNSFIYQVESFLVEEGEYVPEGFDFETDHVDLWYDGIDLVAGAVIISRKNGSSYLRSNATMAIVRELLTEYYSDASRRAKISSYMAAGARNANVDWPVEPIPEVGEVVYEPYTLEGLTGDAAVFNGAQIRVAKSVETGVTVAKYGTTTSGIIIGTNNPVAVDYKSGYALSRVVGEDSASLSLSLVTALSSLPTITI